MLNIKRAETYELAKTVAERTGLSLTDAVTLALKEKLAGLEEAQGRESERRVAKMEQLAKDFRKAWGEPLPTRAELDAEMYDEYGAPK